MFKYEEILPNELIKVLVCCDDIEEEVFAKVVENKNLFLRVLYLSSTSKTYKGACVYSFESEPETVELESLTEHHQGIIDVLDIGFSKIGKNMFVVESEIDNEEQNSDIINSEDEESDEDSFIVDDDTVDGKVEPPPNHREIDEEWNKWNPTTPGATKFKETVEMLEMMAKHHADDLNF